MVYSYFLITIFIKVDMKTKPKGIEKRIPLGKELLVQIGHDPLLTFPAPCSGHPGR
jgi:hypothetical protein